MAAGRCASSFRTFSRLLALSGAVVVLTGSLAAPARAQQPTRQQPAEAKHAKAVRVPRGRIEVDGRLSEDEWRLGSPATDFVQQQPAEGQPTTHRSDVWFVYDDEFLYIGATLHEDEPRRLVTNELKRDFNARDGDVFVVALDTFHDRLNSYNFQANPGCALRDAQSYDDGRTNNPNWDAVWTCRSTVVGDVWTVEMAIPFKQLRFPPGEGHEWGLQIFRLVRHSNEQTMWNPVPRQYNQFKTSYAGVLDGIEGVEPGRNIRVKPFATAQARNVSGGSSVDGGFDTKVGLGTSLVLDGTFRTDFSNVEADAQQVNLTRFNLFFPEKREFFLENQGAFQIGPPAGATSNLVPFFSRTIGLSDTGTPIPIVGGVRLSGKAGRNQIGLLNMQTEREERPGQASLPAANVTVARYGREFASNSMVGGFVMDKERGDTSNRLAGADLRFYPTRAWNIDALVMRSSKTGVGDGTAWRTGVQYSPRLDQYTFSFTSLGTSFQDDLGFVPRSGVGILNLSYLRRWQPRPGSRVREVRGELPLARYAGGGVVQTATFVPAVTTEFLDASTLLVAVGRDAETLDKPFRPQGIPSGHAIAAGRHVFHTGDILYTPANAHRIAPTGEYRFGEYYTGTRRGFTAGARFRVSSKLAATASVSRDSVSLPDTSFHTTLASLRVDASFSTRMFLNAFIQYNSVTHQVSSNIRYDFIHHPLSDLFVTYNDTRDVDGVQAPSRQLAIKVTRLFSF